MVWDRALSSWNNVGTKLDQGHPVNISCRAWEADGFLIVVRKPSVLSGEQRSWGYSLPTVARTSMFLLCLRREVVSHIVQTGLELLSDLAAWHH